MPIFYFHMATPDGRELDEVGVPLPSADHAVVEAWRAAIEISADRARRGQPSSSLRFEVCDAAGRPVFDLSFADVLAGPARRAPAAFELTRERLTETIQHSRRLQAEVTHAVDELRSTLRTTRRLLSGRLRGSPRK